MGEEREAREYEKMAEDAAAGRVAEWEIGLPGADDLTPLSQPLVPPVLASAFSITPEPLRTVLDVHRASQETLSNLRRAAASSFPPFPSDDSMVLEADDPSPKATDAEADAEGDDGDAEPPRKSRAAAEASGDDPSGRALKRPRLVWTPQLHKRFVDVVAHLGIKQAVPKTIMQLMNVEGLTRENVASHLQKYRLYLKRMQGLSSEGPSSSDHLFASTPVPQSLREHPPPPPPPPPPPQPVAMPYAVPTMIPMSMFSMPHPHGQSPVAMVPVNSPQGGGGAYPGLEPHHHHHHHHPYGAFGEQPKDWPQGNKFGSFVSYPRLTPNDK